MYFYEVEKGTELTPDLLATASKETGKAKPIIVFGMPDELNKSMQLRGVMRQEKSGKLYTTFYFHGVDDIYDMRAAQMWLGRRYPKRITAWVVEYGSGIVL